MNNLETKLRPDRVLEMPRSAHLALVTGEVGAAEPSSTS